MGIRNMYVALSTSSTVNKCHRRNVGQQAKCKRQKLRREIIDSISSGKMRQIVKYDLGKSTVNTIWKNRKKGMKSLLKIKKSMKSLVHLEYVVLVQNIFDNAILKSLKTILF